MLAKINKFLKQKSSLSYSLLYQLSASESLVKIGLAVSEIIRDKQTNLKKVLFWCMYRVYIHMSKKRLF